MGKKITNLLSLTSDWNLASRAVINVRNKVIYDLYTANRFVNSKKNLTIYCTNLNTFF